MILRLRGRCDFLQASDSKTQLVRVTSESLDLISQKSELICLG